MSLIKTHHDHLTRHNEALQAGICPALKHLIFQMSESGQKWFCSSGENSLSSPTVPLRPCQGLRAAQLFVHLPSSPVWAQSHPHTAPARSLAQLSVLPSTFCHSAWFSPCFQQLVCNYSLEQGLDAGTTKPVPQSCTVPPRPVNSC